MKPNLIASFRTLALLAIIVTACQPAATAQPDTAQPEPSEEQPVANSNLTEALQYYGWAIPICVWRIDTNSRAFCVPVSQLIKAFPLHADLITTIIVHAADEAYSELRPPTSDPEEIIGQLLGGGSMVGCVPKGENIGAITLGVIRPKTIDTLEALRKACATDINSMSLDELTFGLIVGAATRTPGVALSAESQATYERVYEECAARPARPQDTPMQGGSSEEDRKKQEEDARKKAEDALTKARAAEAAVKAAIEKREAAEKAFQEIEGNPNATQEQKDVARQAVLQADNDYRQAVVVADDAAAAADAAKQDLNSTIANNDLLDAIVDAAKEFKDEKIEDIQEIFTTGRDELVFLSQVLGALWGRLRQFKDCLDDDPQCSSPLSCEEEAQAAALQEELSKYDRPKCNFAVMPLPDDDRCYEELYGVTEVPETLMVEARKMVCKLLEQVDLSCSSSSSSLDLQGLLPIDPCNGPLVMCAPEQAGQQDSQSAILSKPIPSVYSQVNSNMWIDPQTPGIEDLIDSDN